MSKRTFVRFLSCLLFFGVCLTSCAGNTTPAGKETAAPQSGTPGTEAVTSETPTSAPTPPPAPQNGAVYPPFSVLSAAETTAEGADIRISQKGVAIPEAQGFATVSASVEGETWYAAYDTARFEDAALVPAAYSPTMSGTDLVPVPGAAVFSAKDRESGKAFFVFSISSDLSGDDLTARLVGCQYAFLTLFASRYAGAGDFFAFDVVICAALPHATTAQVRGTIGRITAPVAIAGVTDVTIALKEICAEGGRFVYTTMNDAASTPVKAVGTTGMLATMHFTRKYFAPAADVTLAVGDLVSEKPVYSSLVFGDEFDGTALDFTRWSFDVPMTTRNGERQIYESDPASPSVTVADGALHLRAILGGDGVVRSGAINTCGMETFACGRFEMRAKIPADAGTWPAFWMQGQQDGESCFTSTWPKTGEIDILEEIDGDGRSYFTVHTPASATTSNPHGSSLPASAVNISDGEWHTFGLIWTQSQLAWYVDGQIRFVQSISSSAFDCFRDYPQYLLLNLAIEGSWPSGKWTAGTSDFVVDYVRVYQ